MIVVRRIVWTVAVRSCEAAIQYRKGIGTDATHWRVGTQGITCSTRRAAVWAIRALGSGDTLIVWRLDRLGRSIAHLVTLIEELLGRQVVFRALCDGAIDTATASGELIFHIFSALARFERRLIQERTRARLAAARARGRKGGRKPGCAGEPRVRTAYTMYIDQQLSVADICQILRISQATFYGMSPWADRLLRAWDSSRQE